ncbi:hypothetical protein HanPI659440_Chr15g0609371 [Helianthus annuus]|nr:hypothetical protein HanPI659440_Chr15g0609371 [Helianthus annuus]
MSPAHIHHTHTLVSSGNETNRERERDRGWTRKTRVRERERRNTLTSLRRPKTATRPMTPHGDDYDDDAVDDNLISPFCTPWSHKERNDRKGFHLCYVIFSGSRLNPTSLHIGPLIRTYKPFVELGFIFRRRRRYTCSNFFPVLWMNGQPLDSRMAYCNYENNCAFGRHSSFINGCLCSV